MKNRSHLIDDIKWQCWTALRNQNSKSDLAGGGEFVAGQHQRWYLLRPTLTHFRCKLANILIYTFSPDFLAPKVRWHNLFCLQISCLRQHWAKVPPPKGRGIDRSDRRAQCGDQPICHVVSPFFVEVQFVIDDSIIHDAKWKATLRRNGGHIQTSRKQSALVWPCTEEEKQTWWHHCWPGKSCKIIQSSLQKVGNHTNHGVVGLTIVVECDLVESPSARLPPNVLLDHLHKSCPWTTKKIWQQSMNNLCRGDFGCQFVLFSVRKIQCCC